MLRIVIAVAVLGAMVVPALGQDAAQAYVGVVTGQNVRVRTGPGLNHYEMARLSAPTRVTVLGPDRADPAWLHIVPPEGVYSLISKRFVQRDGDIGTVIGDDVNIRAGSDLDTRAVEIAQALATRGSQVRIVGETEEYFKIVPPEGVTVCVSADYVRPADGAGAPVVPQPATPRLAASQPASEATSQPGTAPTTSLAAQRSEQARRELAALEAFQAAETALEAEYAKPAEQRDLRRLLATYQALDVAPDSQLRPFVDYRVRFLELAIERVAAVEQARGDIERALARQLREEAERARIQVDTVRPEPSYAARGRLRASALFDGRGAIPKRWAVYDVGTNEIIAWAQSTTNTVDLRPYEGQVVALKGPRTYNPRLKAYIVEVEQVELADAAAEAPQTPAAIEGADTQPVAPAATLTPDLIPPGHRVYVVEAAGESFFTIAKAIYGNGNHWPAIRDANPAVNPRDIRPGQVLLIPSIDLDADPGAQTAPAETVFDAGR